MIQSIPCRAHKQILVQRNLHRNPRNKYSLLLCLYKSALCCLSLHCEWAMLEYNSLLCIGWRTQIVHHQRNGPGSYRRVLQRNPSHFCASICKRKLTFTGATDLDLFVWFRRKTRLTLQVTDLTMRVILVNLTY